MNLREQFEKTHPIPAKLTNMPNERHFSPEYVEWLEQRNKEQVEVLKKAKDELQLFLDIASNKDNELSCMPEIEEQLKKSGEL